MKGPALWLNHYVRCRQVMSHVEWVILLAVAAKRGLWVQRAELIRISIWPRDRELKKLCTAELIEVRETKSARGHQTCETRITSKGLALLGWPELSVLETEKAKA